MLKKKKKSNQKSGCQLYHAILTKLERHKTEQHYFLVQGRPFTLQKKILFCSLTEGCQDFTLNFQ